MKPDKIIIVRHGQSEANVDKGLYENTPDHLINLTETGERQCLEVGRKLNSYFSKKNVTVWTSPYNRTRQTSKLIMSQCSTKNVKFKEDPRLREQEWGNFYSKEEALKKAENRKLHSYFFYRLENGESGADVYDRLSTFLETLYRDFAHDTWTERILISTHGITSLIFLMRYFHWSYEEYETATKFNNCDYVVLSLNHETDRYEVETDSRT